MVGTFDPAKKATAAPPAEFPAAKGKAKAEAPAGGATGAMGEDAPPAADGLALATMDIFAGCGGLSEGMHQVRRARLGDAAGALVAGCWGGC